MMFQRLTKTSKEDLKAINRLLPQVSNERQLSSIDFKKIFINKDMYLLVLRDKKNIVAMGTLVVMPTVSGLRARIEDVVVDSAYRGQGLGEKITTALIVVAKQKKVKRIELSSRPDRVAANKLYQKLGFKQRETNSYVLKF